METSPALEVGLFEQRMDGGVQLLGRTRDPETIELVRERLIDQRQRETADLIARRRRGIHLAEIAPADESS